MRPPGGFVLVVGPSGAGKDTVIRLARTRLAAEARVVFPRRLVTRPPSADEDNVELTEEAFAEAEARAAFALSWRAHGLGYGIDRDSVALAETGHVVVCNVSRRVVDDARARLPGVSVVTVTASPEVLAQRLAARGRAQDGDLGIRLSRNVPITADCTICNDADREQAADALVAHLRTRIG